MIDNKVFFSLFSKREKERENENNMLDVIQLEFHHLSSENT